MEFQDEYGYLLHLLSCALHGTVPEDIPEHISAEKVLDYGVLHEVANIAFLAVRKLRTPPEESVLSRWQQEYFKAIKRDALQTAARDTILTALHSRGISTLEVQGTVVKRYYPQRHLRMMSDIDIIIPADKLTEAVRILQDFGYATHFTNDAEVFARKGLLNVELHTEFFPSKSIVRPALREPFSHASPNSDGTEAVTDTVFYLFHLLHTIKHASGCKGVGIRRIIDLYYLESAMEDTADLAYVDSVLKDFGFYEIKKKLCAVKDHWFNDIEPDTDLSAFEREILSAGNHGTSAIFYRNQFKNEKTRGKHFIKLRFLLSFLFPSKEEIYRCYPFCVRHRLPLPLCWVYRGIVSVFSRKNRRRARKMLSYLKIKVK